MFEVEPELLLKNFGKNLDSLSRSRRLQILLFLVLVVSLRIFRLMNLPQWKKNNQFQISFLVFEN